ncbi:MAG: RluA family pseudouridine synthase [bacterium]|nr:RluA family pseudouridine synthase [bacterium]
MNLEVKENNIRLDVYIKNNTDYSRSKIQSLIKDGYITVNKKREKESYKVKENDLITISEFEEEITDVIPEKMDLDIVYEDDYLLILNKKSGVVVHPAVGNYNHTLVNGLLYHFNSLSNKNTIRPGIVHRLDKDTSGLMVVAKDDKTHELLSNMIKNKKVERKYLALVWGVIKHDNGTIDAPIGRDINNRQKFIVTDVNSKESVTHFSVIERLNNATLISCKLETGRTHQIRVHLNYIGHPVVNDPVYGNRKMFNEEFGQMLHSKSIRFIHPITKKELFFEIDAPKEFYNILDNFK